MSSQNAGIPVQGYGADSADYYRRGLRCLNLQQEDAKPQWFFYAALELRNCFERLLFEYLDLVRQEEFSKTMEKQYSPKLLKQYILKTEPEFENKLRFAALLHQAIDGVGIYLIGLDDVIKLYGRLGAFLHAPKRPEETVDSPLWWGKLYSAIEDSLNVLDEVYSNAIGMVKLNELGVELYERWKGGAITDAQAQAEFWEGSPWGT